MFHYFANPRRFRNLTGTMLPWMWGLFALTLLYGIIGGFFLAPPDYQQGETFRIIYVHVPSAWLGLFGYAVVAVASLSWLIWRHPLATLAGQAAAPLGAGFTLVALVTGALWGKPMWGTYWVWDARLTSMLILFFLYLGYIAIHDVFDDPERGAGAAAILALVGSVNLPIIKFSVDWWSTLHQPASIMRLDGPSVHSSMLWPLLSMAIAFQLYFFCLMFMRMHALLDMRKAHQRG